MKQKTNSDPGAAFGDLVRLVETLRDPGGCPWDAEQTHSSLRSHLLEETYEALADIDSGDMAGLEEELGDLLTHIVFHADIARRAGEFNAASIARRVAEKLRRRHPHVFGEGPRIAQAEEVVGQWEALKRAEGGRNSIVASLPAAMPALAYSGAVQKRATRAGLPLDGSDDDGPPSFDTVGGDPAELETRAGDYLMAVVRQVQAAGVDPEVALRGAALRLRDRILRAETRAGDTPLADLPEEERLRLWTQA